MIIYTGQVLVIYIKYYLNISTFKVLLHQEKNVAILKHIHNSKMTSFIGYINNAVINY